MSIQLQGHVTEGPFEPTLLAALQLALRHQFADITLLQRALTHSSFINEQADAGLDN